MISTPKAILYDANGNILVGQKPRAESVPVTMASDQPAIPVTFSEANAVTGVSSTILTLGGSTANSLVPMRATVYTEPASAAQRSISSSSALDTAAGTGARTVLIRYYNNLGMGPYEETVILNGTTPVNTVATDIRFIEFLYCPTVGSTGNNQGTITLFGSIAGGGGTVGTIGRGNIVTGVGDMRTLWCHHYSPLNTICAFSTLVAGIQSGGSGTYGRFFLRVAKPLVPNGAEVQIGDVLLIVGAFTRNFDFHQTSAGFLRAVAYCVPGVNNASVSMSFDWQETPV